MNEKQELLDDLKRRNKVAKVIVLVGALPRSYPIQEFLDKVLPTYDDDLLLIEDGVTKITGWLFVE